MNTIVQCELNISRKQICGGTEHRHTERHADRQRDIRLFLPGASSPSRALIKCKVMGWYIIGPISFHYTYITKYLKVKNISLTEMTVNTY